VVVVDIGDDAGYAGLHDHSFIAMVTDSYTEMTPKALSVLASSPAKMQDATALHPFKRRGLHVSPPHQA
jgi:hypothetical protein